MLGGGGKGVGGIRQGMGSVKWGVSISPFSASMAMSVEIPQLSKSSGTLKDPVKGWDPWEQGIRDTEN